MSWLPVFRCSDKRNINNEYATFENGNLDGYEKRIHMAAHAGTATISSSSSCRTPVKFCPKAEYGVFPGLLKGWDPQGRPRTPPS